MTPQTLPRLTQETVLSLPSSKTVDILQEPSPDTCKAFLLKFRCPDGYQTNPVYELRTPWLFQLAPPWAPITLWSSALPVAFHLDWSLMNWWELSLITSLSGGSQVAPCNNGVKEGACSVSCWLLLLRTHSQALCWVPIQKPQKTLWRLDVRTPQATCYHRKKTRPSTHSSGLPCPPWVGVRGGGAGALCTWMGLLRSQFPHHDLGHVLPQSEKPLGFLQLSSVPHPVTPVPKRKLRNFLSPTVARKNTSFSAILSNHPTLSFCRCGPFILMYDQSHHNSVTVLQLNK